MKTYLEFDFKIEPSQPWNEIMIAELAEQGFDSFQEKESELMAYIPKEDFDQEALDALWLLHHDEVKVSYTFQEMPDINWNAKWEANFSPINVEDQISIRAEFHEPQSLPEEIIIQPKMAFGTGHHATTYLMLKQMMQMDFTGKKVLDMGCGTSILGIYAAMHGAADVYGIDVDDWAVDNSLENAARNGVTIRVEQGDARLLGSEKFNVILANINRNVLMADIPQYVQVLEDGGNLLLSGLCYWDEEDITGRGESLGLTLQHKDQRKEWMSLLWKK